MRKDANERPERARINLAPAKPMLIRQANRDRDGLIKLDRSALRFGGASEVVAVVVD